MLLGHVCVIVNCSYLFLVLAVKTDLHTLVGAGRGTVSVAYYRSESVILQ